MYIVFCFLFVNCKIYFKTINKGVKHFYLHFIYKSDCDFKEKNPRRNIQL